MAVDDRQAAAPVQEQSSAPAPPEDRGRVGWVDVAKGIGILLVVVGHVLRGLMGADIVQDRGAAAFVDSWIYAFHMPLFFFLSGLFAMRAARRPAARFISDKLRTIAYPYLVWSLVQTLVQIALAGATNNPAGLEAVLKIPYQPPMQFWFLYALLVMSVGLMVLVKLRLPPAAILGLSLVVYVLPQVVTLGGWGVVYAVARNLVYFTAGAVVGPRLLAGAKGPSKAAAVLVAACSLGVMTAGVIAGMHRVFGGELVAAGLGIVGVVAAAMGAPAAGAAARSGLARGVEWLRWWGRASLQIYVAHTLGSAGARIVLERMVGIEHAWVHIVAGVAAGMGFPLLLDGSLRRLGIRRAFVWSRRRPVGLGGGDRGERPAAAGRGSKP